MAEGRVRYAVDIREPLDTSRPLLGWSRVIMVTTLTRANELGKEIGKDRTYRIMRVEEREVFNSTGKSEKDDDRGK